MLRKNQAKLIANYQIEVQTFVTIQQTMPGSHLVLRKLLATYAGNSSLQKTFFSLTRHHQNFAKQLIQWEPDNKASTKLTDLVENYLANNKELKGDFYALLFAFFYYYADTLDISQQTHPNIWKYFIVKIQDQYRQDKNKLQTKPQIGAPKNYSSANKAQTADELLTRVLSAELSQQKIQEQLDNLSDEERNKLVDKLAASFAICDANPSRRVAIYTKGFNFLCMLTIEIAKDKLEPIIESANLYLGSDNQKLHEASCNLISKYYYAGTQNVQIAIISNLLDGLRINRQAPWKALAICKTLVEICKYVPRDEQDKIPVAQLCLALASDSTALSITACKVIIAYAHVLVKHKNELVEALLTQANTKRLETYPFVCMALKSIGNKKLFDDFFNELIGELKTINKVEVIAASKTLVQMFPAMSKNQQDNLFKESLTLIDNDILAIGELLKLPLPSQSLEAFFERLLSKFEHKDTIVRSQAIELLTQLSNEYLIPAKHSEVLCQKLKVIMTATHAGIRQRACAILPKFSVLFSTPNGEMLLAALKKLLTDESDEVRFDAYKAFGQLSGAIPEKFRGEFVGVFLQEAQSDWYEGSSLPTFLNQVRPGFKMALAKAQLKKLVGVDNPSHYAFEMFHKLDLPVPEEQQDQFIKTVLDSFLPMRPHAVKDIILKLFTNLNPTAQQKVKLTLVNLIDDPNNIALSKSAVEILHNLLGKLSSTEQAQLLIKLDALPVAQKHVQPAVKLSDGNNEAVNQLKLAILKNKQSHFAALHTPAASAQVAIEHEM